LISSIVVGTDGSDTAANAVLEARSVARALGAKVHLVRAYLPVPAGGTSRRQEVEELLRAAAQSMEEDGVQVVTYAREGDPADAILDVAEETGANLIVIGNKGMTGSQRFLLGSVPNKISHNAPCSVLIVRTT
jgi:nucleotide-binding universal stress UspA family protein